MRDNITAAREQTARTLATRELACWDGEYSPSTAEYIAAHYRATHAILEPCGPLDPLCAAYEAKLAKVTRERDEARACAEQSTRERDAAESFIRRLARMDGNVDPEIKAFARELDGAAQLRADRADPSRRTVAEWPCGWCGRPCWHSSTGPRFMCREGCIGEDCSKLREAPRG